MEFPSSLNKAKPTELWQIECPDIYWPHSKIVFVKWKSKRQIISMLSGPAAACADGRQAKRKARVATP
jgi:hypothetical protein